MAVMKVMIAAEVACSKSVHTSCKSEVFTDNRGKEQQWQTNAEAFSKPWAIVIHQVRLVKAAGVLSNVELGSTEALLLAHILLEGGVRLDHIPSIESSSNVCPVGDVAATCAEADATHVVFLISVQVSHHQGAQNTIHEQVIHVVAKVS